MDDIKQLGRIQNAIFTNCDICDGDLGVRVHISRTSMMGHFGCRVSQRQLLLMLVVSECGLCSACDRMATQQENNMDNTGRAFF